MKDEPQASSWLSADVGNTRVRVVRHWAGRSDLQAVASWSHADPCPEGRLASGETLWLASVAPEERTAALCERLERLRGEAPMRVQIEDGRPLRLAYDTPSSLGADRVLAAAGAWKPGRGSLILDVGTAITLDGVDEQGCFLGGAIAPGGEALALGLATLAPALPSLGRPELGATPPWPARSSADSVRLGLEAALAGTLKELLRRAREGGREFWALVLTGGGSEAAARLLDAERDPWLIHRGIARWREAAEAVE